MKTSSLILLTTLLSAFPLAALAQTPSSIEELDQGACWLQAAKQDDRLLGYRAVSFGSGVAFTLLKDELTPEGVRLKDIIRAQLKTKFATLPALKYEVGFHCYASGHTITIQVERPGAQPVCLNAKVKSGTSLHDLDVFAMHPNVSFSEGSICLGIDEATLGLSLKNAGDAEVSALTSMLTSSEVGKIIDKVEYRSGSFFALARLKPEYAYREVEAKTALEANAQFMTHVTNLWFNTMNTIEGEDRILFQGTTDAY